MATESDLRANHHELFCWGRRIQGSTKILALTIPFTMAGCFILPDADFLDGLIPTANANRMSAAAGSVFSADTKSRTDPNASTDANERPNLVASAALPADTKWPAVFSAFADAEGVADTEIVADAELAYMRGRFVESGLVKYFGVQMYTIWQDAEDVIMAVGLDWEVNLPGGVNSPAVVENPIVSFFHLAPDGTEPSVRVEDLGVTLGPDQGALEKAGALDFRNFGQPNGKEPKPLPATARAGGLENTQGIVQGILAAGDHNDLGQDLSINIVDDPPVVSFGAAAGPVGVPQDLDRTTTFEFSSGFKATAFIENDAIGVVVKSKGLGLVMQEIDGGQGHVAQLVNLQGSMNFVRSSLNINIGIDRNAPSDRTNFETTLQSIRGLRR